jgi:predicted NBD/HSP70 family sugar kinase
MNLSLKCTPSLDPDFQPASLWVRAHESTCRETAGSRTATLWLERHGVASQPLSVPLGPDVPDWRERNCRVLERLVKSLLWVQGGNCVCLHGADAEITELRALYRTGSGREFDAAFMGERCFDAPFIIETRTEPPPDIPAGTAPRHAGQLNGCRIGFDLGGSDRKCAAVIDGEVVFSEEVKWNPYFQSDPEYHRNGILDTIRRAAEKLPRVDAIGGSAAGIYIDNEPRVASLFRGVADADFRQQIRPLFHEIQKSFGNIPFVVANDGDVTALAGSLASGKTGILGVSMGTSQAAGYLDPKGNLTGWLNELAFVPVDFNPDAPADEWSGDRGCGVQYFSQQAVGRLARRAGFAEADELELPELLEHVQSRVAEGDAEAKEIFKTIGIYFGYALAWYTRFYDFTNVLTLGRVTSGTGGTLIVDGARMVLEAEFPELGKCVQFIDTDETTKRHGQAVAAACLPHLT